MTVPDLRSSSVSRFNSKTPKLSSFCVALTNTTYGQARGLAFRLNNLGPLPC